jgi:cobalt-zinc-cadmium efflux system outer membrane protein
VLPHESRRVRRTLAALHGALFLLAACQTNGPDPAVESAIAEAAALGEPVTFLVEGGPLDEPPAEGALTFSDATRRAVTTDPGLQSALARVRIAMADAHQSRLLPNPVLNFVLRWGSGQPQFEVSLAQDISRAFQIPRRSSAADNRLQQAATDAVTVALDVVAEVQERYAGVQAADRLLPVLEERLELLERNVGIARSRLDAGEGVRGDVTTLDAQRVELEAEIDEAKNGQRRERLRLARLIGEPSGAAQWRLDDWLPPSATASSEQIWIDAALRHRPEVQSVVWQLAALGDDYALTRLLPWQGAGLGVDAQRNPDWFVGPSISTPIPIFDIGQAHRERVTAEQIEARHALTMSKRSVVEEVRLAHHGLDASLTQLERMRRELIPLQQQRRDQAEQAYRAGQTDATSLFLAEQDLRATQADAIELERLASISLIRLQRAVGGPGVVVEVDQAPPEADSQADGSTPRGSP